MPVPAGILCLAALPRKPRSDSLSISACRIGKPVFRTEIPYHSPFWVINCLDVYRSTSAGVLNRIFQQVRKGLCDQFFDQK